MTLRRTELAALTLLLAALPAAADLPSTGWPQERRDAARSGRSDEPALADPVVAWESPVGPWLSGEPVADGCSVFVGDGAGDVVRLDALDGSEQWRAARGLAPCGPATLPSRVALDDAGRVLAGWPGGEALEAAARALCSILSGIGSYSIDNNEYPPGLDLVAEIAPTYVTWPDNACTGSPMRDSDVASPGDLRYERVTQGEFRAGLWWSDGGLVSGESACGWWPPAWGTMPPDWPRSHAVQPGRALDAADGAELWRLPESAAAAEVTPSVTPDGVAWTQAGMLTRLDGGRVGRLAVTDPDGTARWALGLHGGASGGAARDAGSGALVVAHRWSDLGPLWRALIVRLATAVESYSIDHNAYPDAADLEAVLVPTYLGAMANNVLEGRTARWSMTPSPGDYAYEVSPDRTEYGIWWWTARGEAYGEFRTGSFVSPDPGPDESALLQALAPDGSVRWWLDLGLDPGPVALHQDGSVLVATADGMLRAQDLATGAPRWSHALGGVATTAPALLPDGGIVVVVNGALACVDPPGITRWTSPPGPRFDVAPAATSDGVILAGDASGVLRAFSAAGAELWARPLGGPALTTTPILADGRILVGRADGVLVALEERGRTHLAPLTSGLLVSRAPQPGEVALSWPEAAPSSVAGAHYHVWRHRGSPLAPPEAAHAGHGLVDRGLVDAGAGPGLVFYSLSSADACEREPGP